MNHSTTLILLLALSGCIPVSENYFLPTAKEYRSEGYTCGKLPYGGYINKIAAGVTLSISGAEAEKSTNFFFQFIVEKNHTLELTHHTISISGASLSAKSGELDFLSGTNVRTVPTLHIGNSSATSRGFANVNFEGALPSKITMTVPKLIIDSNTIEIPPIEFERIVKNGFMSCIQ